MIAGSQLQAHRAICQFSRLPVNPHPFPHVQHQEFIDPQIYQELAQSFPTCPSSTGPTGHSLYWGDSEYQKLLDNVPGWRGLFDTFHSQAFIDWAREQFAPYWTELGCTIDLSKARYVPYREDRVDKELAALRVVEHEPEELWVRLDIHQGQIGYTRAVHVDHRRRLLSMLVYFCDQQEIQMHGGELLLHDAEGRVTTRVLPQHNLMVAFPCAVNSTHSVAPITALAAPRNYVQVHISGSVDIWDDSVERKRTAYERIGSAKPYSFASPATAVATKTYAGPHKIVWISMKAAQSCWERSRERRILL